MRRDGESTSSLSAGVAAVNGHPLSNAAIRTQAARSRLPRSSLCRYCLIPAAGRRPLFNIRLSDTRADEITV